MPVSPETVTLYNAEGEPIEGLPHEPITEDELRLLLAYRKFLLKHGYREAIYCNRCWGNNLSDGTRMHVKDEGLTIEAMIKCRCRVAYGKGSGLVS